MANEDTLSVSATLFHLATHGTRRLPNSSTYLIWTLGPQPLDQRQGRTCRIPNQAGPEDMQISIAP